jgi:hypothetical protein
MMRVRPAVFALVLSGVVGGVPPAEAATQVKAPPRADKVDLEIRYRIRADRDERVRQFRAMMARLKQLGFVPSEREDADLDALDPAAERLSGTIPSANVFAVLEDPRIQTILFAPAGFKYPDAPDHPVAVRIGLRSGFEPAQQRQLHRQAVARLEQLGFREAAAYDHQRDTLVRGSIPRGNVMRLLRDLRTEPAGWFLPDTPPDRLPVPLRNVLPVVWVEVLPVGEPAAPYTPPAVPPAQAKFTPDLRAALADPKSKNAAAWVEVVLGGAATNYADAIRDELRTRYGKAALLGVIGNVASVRFERPEDVERFAALPAVVTVRLPRESTGTVFPGGPAEATRAVLQATRVEDLHRFGYRGAGVRVVVIGTDFTGAGGLLGTALPKRTSLLDLTAELNPTLEPLPPSPNRAGSGTAAARAVALAAPDADIVLVRVHPAAMFQLLTVARAARGEDTYSDAMVTRLNELSVQTEEVRTRKALVAEEYSRAFANLADDEPARQRREQARQALDQLLAREQELIARVNRFTALRQALAALRGTRVLVNTLTWESGYPLDGLSEVSRTIDRWFAPQPTAGRTRSATRPDPRALTPVWVQAASPSGASVWGGPYRDENDNGVMEFVGPDHPAAVENWSRELNFLGLRDVGGQTAAELPAGARVRLVAQWREPFLAGMGPAPGPLFPLVIRVYRQEDPTGTTRYSDDVTEVARSAPRPSVVLLTETFAVYEQMVEFTVPTAGRYAVAVEGGRPDAPQLPALQRQVEVHPRLFVESVGSAPGQGRVVFRSYLTTDAGVGIPGDAAQAVTVATALGGLVGGGTGVALRAKPDFLAPDDLPGGPDARGPGVAAGFAGGVAALLVEAGAAAPDVFIAAGFERGKPLRVPDAWFGAIRPKPVPIRP